MLSYLRLAIVSCLLLACSEDPLTPKDIAGDYVLQTYDGNSLPVMRAQTDSCDFLLTQGTLALGLDSLFHMQLSETVDCSRAGQTPGDVGNLWEGPYQLTGSSLSLSALGSQTLTFTGEYHDGSILLSLVNSSLGAGPHQLRFGPAP